MFKSVSSEERGNFWLSPAYSTGSLTLDLGCPRTFAGLQLVNTHNAAQRGWNTERFRWTAAVHF